jgi:hypothetical protein
VSAISDITLSVIGASLLVSFSSLSGLFVLWIEPAKLQKIVPYLVALAVGVVQAKLELDKYNEFLDNRKREKEMA